MANRTRTNEIKIFLSDDEIQVLDAKTKAAGMRSRSDTIRHLIIESMLYEIDYKELREYNYQLGKIGTNINQVARRINETRSIYQEDINKLKEEMNSLWQLQKSMLSKQPLARP